MGALDGYKILDFTTLLPGPYATMTLADMGAEVLKVSGRDKYDLVVNWPPVVPGAQVTGAQAWLGRNKKTMFLNLKKPAAVEAVKSWSWNTTLSSSSSARASWRNLAWGMNSCAR